MKVSTMFNEDFHQVSLAGHEDEALECIGPLELLMLEEEFEDPEDALEYMRIEGITCW